MNLISSSASSNQAKPQHGTLQVSQNGPLTEAGGFYGIHPIANSNYRIKVIEVNAMSLSFIINRSMMSGYFHLGNNHFTNQFPIVRGILQSYNLNSEPAPAQSRKFILGISLALMLQAMSM